MQASVRREVAQWLEDEVRDGPLLRPHKQELSEAVGRRRPVLVSARSEDRLLDPADTLGTVFVEEAGRSLLILGAPGSGKSVLLHQLARDLLDRARDSPREPIPVLLSLAGWTDDGRSFLDWLASREGLGREHPNYTDAELRAWLQQKRLCLLLDGLDEVQPEHRARCVEAINAFVAGADDGALGGLAVCCRFHEYQALSEEGATLTLGAAIYLQPLTEAQVTQYIATGGEALAGLRAAYDTDPVVRELAENPLMLSTMSVAFKCLGAEHLGSLPREDRLGRLLDAFVARVFERAEERADLPYDRAQTLRRLGWLAERLLGHGRGTFYLEEVQPSWLPTGHARLGYAVLSRGAGGLLLGLVTGGLLLMGLGVTDPSEATQLGSSVLALSVAGALLAGAVDLRCLTRPPAAGMAPPDPALRAPILVLPILVVMSLLGGLFFGAAPAFRIVHGLQTGALWGAVVLVVFEPGAGWRTAARDVRLAEPLRWSWRGAWRAARRGAGWGAPIGAAAGGLLLRPFDPYVVLFVAVTVAATAAFVGGTLGGLQPGNVAAKAGTNRGLALSLRNAAFAGLLTALAAAVAFLLLGLASDGLHLALQLSLSGGLFFGLLAALRYGGLNAVYHYTLRLLLARTGRLPFRSGAFLDHATALSLMRRSGGGYAFAHRIFAEHLADRGEAPGSVPLDRLSTPAPSRIRPTDPPLATSGDDEP